MSLKLLRQMSDDGMLPDIVIARLFMITVYLLLIHIARNALTRNLFRKIARNLMPLVLMDFARSSMAHNMFMDFVRNSMLLLPNESASQPNQQHK